MNKYELTLEEYVNQCESNIKRLEGFEMYEECQQMLDLVNSIKTKNVKEYIELSFDINGLLEARFFKTKPTTEQAEIRLKKFFDLESIFEYSLLGGGMFCSFHRNLKILESK